MLDYIAVLVSLITSAYIKLESLFTKLVMDDMIT